MTSRTASASISWWIKGRRSARPAVYSALPCPGKGNRTKQIGRYSRQIIPCREYLLFMAYRLDDKSSSEMYCLYLEILVSLCYCFTDLHCLEFGKMFYFCNAKVCIFRNFLNRHFSSFQHIKCGSLFGFRYSLIYSLFYSLFYSLV